MKKILNLVVLGVILLVSVSMSIRLTKMSHQGVKNAKASASWPSTKGIITRSEVFETRDEEQGIQYDSIITYNYNVGGATITGDRIKFGWMSGAAVDLDNRVNKYPKGTEVTVFYDPSEPSKSVLEPGFEGSMWSAYRFGAYPIFAGLGAVAIMGVIMLKKEKNETGESPNKEAEPDSSA